MKTCVFNFSKRMLHRLKTCVMTHLCNTHFKTCVTHETQKRVLRKRVLQESRKSLPLGCDGNTANGVMNYNWNR